MRERAGYAPRVVRTLRGDWEKNPLPRAPIRCYNSFLMIPESEMMAQARRALREERWDDAQSILVNVVVTEPGNDEAWLLLAETIQDPERKMECLEKARRIDPRNPATQRAIQSLQNEIARAAFGQMPAPAESPPNEIPTRPELAGPLLEYAETIAQAVMMSIEPSAIRTLGLELVHQIELAVRHDAVRVRRWARSAGRDALVKYERALTTLIANLPQNDAQLALLREQRQRALDLMK
jgi:hypothetical protein